MEGSKLASGCRMLSSGGSIDRGVDGESLSLLLDWVELEKVRGGYSLFLRSLHCVRIGGGIAIRGLLSRSVEIIKDLVSVLLL